MTESCSFLQTMCLHNGTWSRGPPRCKPSCEFPGKPSHGRLLPRKFHYDVGENVQVHCNQGYRVLKVSWSSKPRSSFRLFAFTWLRQAGRQAGRERESKKENLPVYGR